MRKTILTPEECGKLIPHWPELKPEKLRRLNRGVTRIKKLSDGQRVSVMDVVPVLIASDGYILNGKHRAYVAARDGYCLEACVVERRGDVVHHVPAKAYGERGVEGIFEAYDNMPFYRGHSASHGVRRINDLVERNRLTGDALSRVPEPSAVYPI